MKIAKSTVCSTRYCISLFVFAALLQATAEAIGLSFSPHYSDNMVMQRDKPVLIRGFADQGEDITVRFAGQRKMAKVDDGVWSVTLDPMPANANPQELVAHSSVGNRKSTIADVLVGDVFLFARQSSIDVSLGRDEKGRLDAADVPSVRVMMIRTIPALEPPRHLAQDATAGWTVLNKATALKMSAAAFYAAKGLVRTVDVPIGIIDLNMGNHFPIAWLSKDALLETTEVFGAEQTRVDTTMEMMAEALATFQDQKARVRSNAKRGYPMPHPLGDARYPAACYNAVLHPMRGLALRGLLLQLGNDYPYYLYERLVREGKSTSRSHLGQVYEDTYNIRKWGLYLEPTTTPRIPRAWRSTFGDTSLPVGWIAPPGSDLVTLGRHHREMRELQRQTAMKEEGVDSILPGTEHIPFSAQPADEVLLGERCLAWLKGAVYKEDGAVATGPVFDRAEMNYSTARLFFKPGTARGLTAREGALDAFEVAGVELEYTPARATIDGETIRLSSDTVPRITQVRYNWTAKPDQGLTNASGLPTMPFSTDDHAYPKTISTIGEEELPPEFSTPVTKWETDGPVIFSGKLKTGTNVGRYLGPTGLRVSTFGPNLFVNSAYIGSPSDGKIVNGDFLYGVNGKTFGEDMFRDIAEAITQAETEQGEGIISFDLLRDGERMTVALQLEVLGTYSPTAPYDCPKTDRIVANAESFLAKYGGVVPGHPVFSNADAMFLLAAGSPEYQGLVRRHVYNRMLKTDINQAIDPEARAPKPQGSPWELSADMLLLSEYYLATGDENVLPYLRYMCDTLTTLQIRALDETGPWPQVQQGQTGGWRHNFYGGATYGTLPAIQVPATLGYHLAKEAGVEYDFTGYDRAVRWFLHNGAKIGSIYYGYSAEPRTAGNSIDPDKLAAGKLNPGNGGVAGAAILFDLRNNGPVARSCSLVSTYSFNNTSHAHGGYFWVNFYNPLGAKIHSKKAFQFYMRKNRWHQELHRMHDYSRQQDRVFGAGQFLAYVAPRERLRMLGAHESVFAPNPPEALHAALAAYRSRDYAACEQAAAAVIEKGDTHGLDLQKAKQLRDAAALIQRSIAHDLAEVRRLIEENKPYEASLDMTQLEAVLPSGNAELAAIERALNTPALKGVFAQDRQRYGAHISSLALQLPPERAETDDGEWKALVSNVVRKADGPKAATEPTMWRIKTLESLQQAPPGWTEPEFDDRAWKETTLPISWHLNHTAVLRAPFDIADAGEVKALRLTQYAFRQDAIQVFINGQTVAKISESGGGSQIIVPLNEHALKLLKNGRNILAATYKNTWRWGRYFRGKDSVYQGGVNLMLEMEVK